MDIVGDYVDVEKIEEDAWHRWFLSSHEKKILPFHNTPLLLPLSLPLCLDH